jgi:hypothetical protein
VSNIEVGEAIAVLGSVERDGELMMIATNTNFLTISDYASTTR